MGQIVWWSSEQLSINPASGSLDSLLTSVLQFGHFSEAQGKRKEKGVTIDNLQKIANRVINTVNTNVHR